MQLPSHHITTMSAPLLLDVTKACAALGGICARTLWTLTSPRGPLPCVKIGGRVMYSLRDLEKFVDTQRA